MHQTSSRVVASSSVVVGISSYDVSNLTIQCKLINVSILPTALLLIRLIN